MQATQSPSFKDIVGRRQFGTGRRNATSYNQRRPAQFIFPSSMTKNPVGVESQYQERRESREGLQGRAGNLFTSQLQNEPTFEQPKDAPHTRPRSIKET